MTLTFQDLAQAMLKCDQTKNQTVYQHGVSVKQHLAELIDALERLELLPNWKLPSYLLDYKEQILSNLHSEEVVSAYTVYHDCGKPFCREMDAEGKDHYPNHADVSKKLFIEAGGDPIAAKLIGWDMVLHSSTAEEIQLLCETEWTTQDACTLLLTALAELHSNCRLFGGMDSISFKSKWKTLERRGKQICKHFFKEMANG